MEFSYPEHSMRKIIRSAQVAESLMNETICSSDD